MRMYIAYFKNIKLHYMCRHMIKKINFLLSFPKKKKDLHLVLSGEILTLASTTKISIPKCRHSLNSRGIANSHALNTSSIMKIEIKSIIRGILYEFNYFHFAKVNAAKKN